MRMWKKLNRKNDYSEKSKDKICSSRIEILELQEKIRILKEENKSLRKYYKISDNISGDDIETILARIEINRLNVERQELASRLRNLDIENNIFSNNK